MDQEPGPDRVGAAPGAPGPASSRWRRRPAVLGAVAALTLGALAWIWSSGRSDATPPLTRAEVAKTASSIAAAAVGEAAAAPARSVAVYQAIVPSLVFIATTGAAGSVPGSVGEGADDPIVDGPTEGGLGAGVVINDLGAILTAYHVVADASAIEVTFADGTTGKAQIVNAEPENDIAVLVADRAPEVIVPAVMGGGVQVGDEAYAVGHPLGLSGSMSAGVISGLNRSVPRPGGPDLEGLIQFDAAVNPGSSGGPLLNRSGQVVGIVTALANPSKQGYFVGVGFAVPIGTAGGAAGGPDR
jgi:S1-C subfamily serine protease